MAKDKQKFLEVFEKKLGNISSTCRSANVSRQTYYDWMKDQAFSDQVGNVKESLIDLTEDKLLENINKGKTAEIIFYLKTKGKSRGYIEKQEIETIGEKMFEVKILDETNRDK
jgi:hypothetical protein